MYSLMAADRCLIKADAAFSCVITEVTEWIGSKGEVEKTQGAR